MGYIGGLAMVDVSGDLGVPPDAQGHGVRSPTVSLNTVHEDIKKTNKALIMKLGHRTFKRFTN